MFSSNIIEVKCHCLSLLLKFFAKRRTFSLYDKVVGSVFQSCTAFCCSFQLFCGLKRAMPETVYAWFLPCKITLFIKVIQLEHMIIIKNLDSL